jgi:hypothetical protein
MARYRVQFLDFGGNVRASHEIDQDDDEAAIDAAHRMNVLPRISSGFQIGSSMSIGLSAERSSR